MQPFDPAISRLEISRCLVLALGQPIPSRFGICSIEKHNRHHQLEMLGSQRLSAVLHAFDFETTR